MSDAHRVNTTYNNIKNRISGIAIDEFNNDESSSDSEDSTNEHQLHKTYEKFKAETNYF